MFITRAKYEELVRSRNNYESIAESTLKLNREILENNSSLLEKLKEAYDTIEYLEKGVKKDGTHTLH